MLQTSSPLPAQKFDKAAHGVIIAQADDCARFVLRIDPDKLMLAEKAFGLAIPSQIGGMEISEGHRTICLGPDEWLLHATPEQVKDLTQSFSELYSDYPHSFVEISDREIGISITGAEAGLVINANCPRDLDPIPNGSATRTIFDSTPVTLIKFSGTEYRIEVWRSFAEHVWDLLSQAAAEITTRY